MHTLKKEKLKKEAANITVGSFPGTAQDNDPLQCVFPGAFLL